MQRRRGGEAGDTSASCQSCSQASWCRLLLGGDRDLHSVLVHTHKHKHKKALADLHAEQSLRSAACHNVELWTRTMAVGRLRCLRVRRTCRVLAALLPSCGLSVAAIEPPPMEMS